MEPDTLTTFVLQNPGILVLVCLGITAIGVALGFLLAASAYQKSKMGSQSEPQESLQDLTTSVRALEKSLEDLKNQVAKTSQELVGQLRDIQKQARSTRKDLDSLRREVDYLGNMERMATSGTFAAQQQEKEEEGSEKEDVEEDSAQTGFWRRFKKGAKYAVPIWGQWRLIREMREKKKTGSAG